MSQPCGRRLKKENKKNKENRILTLPRRGRSLLPYQTNDTWTAYLNESVLNGETSHFLLYSIVQKTSIFYAKETGETLFDATESKEQIK